MSRKLRGLGPKQTSATILSSNVMQETAAPGLILLMKYASFMHAVIYQTSTEGPAQAQTGKTGSRFAVE